MASNPNASPLEEKRSQARLAVKQPARVIFAGGQEVDCEITNFCLGGLFLKFAPSSESTEWPKGIEGGQIRVAFTIPEALGGQSYDLTATLVRQSESGAGVAFDVPPVPAMLALNKVASINRSHKKAIAVHKEVEHDRLEQACKQHLQRAIADIFSNFARLSPPIFEQAIAATRVQQERECLQSALNEIPSALEAIEQLGRELLLGRLEESRSLAARPETGTPHQVQPEREDFEDWISLTTLSNRLSDRYASELDVLVPRLEELLGATLDAWDNPFVPDSICSVIRGAFSELQLPKTVRLIIDLALHDAMVEPLGALYTELLALLPKAEGEDIKDAAAEGKDQGTGEARPTMGSVASALVSNTQTDGSGQITLSASGLKVLKDLMDRGIIPTARRDEAKVSAKVFAKLLNAISTEQSVPAEVRNQFLQLEEALLRLALLDPSYLNNPEHPAHTVLNAMDRLALVSSDDGRIEDERILASIGKWVERISNEVESNPQVFAQVQVQVENSLRPLLKERNIRIAQLQAALEGWQKTGQANRRILLMLEHRVGGREVPALVLELFKSGWRNYLIRVILRQGEGCVEESLAWEILDTLFDWLAPEPSVKPSYQEIQRLLQDVDSRLRHVCADRDMQDRLIERLTRALLGQDRTSYQAVNTVLAAPSPGAPEDSPSESEDVPLDAFRVGDWFSFEGMLAPLNLIWIGDDPSSYVFCNYKGVKKIELDRNEFGRRVVSGRAKPADNLELPLIERSFSSMIQRIHQDLLTQASVDEQTGLADRREFMRQAAAKLLDRTMAGNAAQGRKQAIGVLDVESLRVLRKRLSAEGYAGLTRALAMHLEKAMESSLLAHGSDYAFAFMLPVDSFDQMQSRAENIISEVSRFSYKSNDTVYTLSANLGMVGSSMAYPPEELYSLADEACLEAKHLGRNRVIVRTLEEIGPGGQNWLEDWSSKITEWLQNDRLYLRCQPIVDAQGEFPQSSHYEILLGVEAADGEPVNVGEMMAAVEQLRRASEIDQWVVRTAFDWMRGNAERLSEIDGLSINLSAQSINSRSFLDFLSAEMNTESVPGEKLIFEITESAAIEGFAHAERFIRKMRRYGCRFALDDFGVGFSSFSYLKNLKVDYLKIDGSFVRSMSRNEVDRALVSSMHQTSRFLGIKTIAEVVENKETLEILKNIGVNYAQGYFTGMPLPLAQLAVSVPSPEPACQA